MEPGFVTLKEHAEQVFACQHDIVGVVVQYSNPRHTHRTATFQIFSVTLMDRSIDDPITIDGKFEDGNRLHVPIIPSIGSVFIASAVDRPSKGSAWSEETCYSCVSGPSSGDPDSWTDDEIMDEIERRASWSKRKQRQADRFLGQIDPTVVRDLWKWGRESLFWNSHPYFGQITWTPLHELWSLTPEDFGGKDMKDMNFFGKVTSVGPNQISIEDGSKGGPFDENCQRIWLLNECLKAPIDAPDCFVLLTNVCVTLSRAEVRLRALVRTNIMVLPNDHPFVISMTHQSIDVSIANRFPDEMNANGVSPSHLPLIDIKRLKMSSQARAYIAGFPISKPVENEKDDVVPPTLMVHRIRGRVVARHPLDCSEFCQMDVLKDALGTLNEWVCSFLLRIEDHTDSLDVLFHKEDAESFLGIVSCDLNKQKGVCEAITSLLDELESDALPHEFLLKEYFANGEPRFRCLLTTCRMRTSQ